MTPNFLGEAQSLPGGRADLTLVVVPQDEECGLKGGHSGQEAFFAQDPGESFGLFFGSPGKHPAGADFFGGDKTHQRLPGFVVRQGGGGNDFQGLLSGSKYMERDG